MACAEGVSGPGRSSCGRGRKMNDVLLVILQELNKVLEMLIGILKQ
jgi:hypothetical protein